MIDREEFVYLDAAAVAAVCTTALAQRSLADTDAVINWLHAIATGSNTAPLTVATGVRMMPGGVGRFTTPDPLVPAAAPAPPQPPAAGPDLTPEQQRRAWALREVTVALPGAGPAQLFAAAHWLLTGEDDPS